MPSLLFSQIFALSCDASLVRASPATESGNSYDELSSNDYIDDDAPNITHLRVWEGVRVKLCHKMQVKRILPVYFVFCIFLTN